MLFCIKIIRFKQREKQKETKSEHDCNSNNSQWSINFTPFASIPYSEYRNGTYKKRKLFCVYICISHIFINLEKFLCIAHDMCSQWVSSIRNDKNNQNSKHNIVFYILIFMLTFVCISKMAIYIRLKFIGWYGVVDSQFPRKKPASAEIANDIMSGTKKKFP